MSVFVCENLKDKNKGLGPSQRKKSGIVGTLENYRTEAVIQGKLKQMIQNSEPVQLMRISQEKALGNTIDEESGMMRSGQSLSGSVLQRVINISLGTGDKPYRLRKRVDVRNYLRNKMGWSNAKISKNNPAIRSLFQQQLTYENNGSFEQAIKTLTDRKDFELAWNASQENPIGKRHTFGERDHVLIISEAVREEERTSRLHPKANVHKTIYPGEFAWQRGRLKGKDDGTWTAWDWTQDPPQELSRRSFNFIIARSLICACEEEHFEGDLGPGSSEAPKCMKSTCGGVGAAQRSVVLNRVISLLKAGGKAIFTVSLHDPRTSAHLRTLARKRTAEYWMNALSTIHQMRQFRVSILKIPAGSIEGEPAGEFFGFVIERFE